MMGAFRDDSPGIWEDLRVSRDIPLASLGEKTEHSRWWAGGRVHWGRGGGGALQEEIGERQGTHEEDDNNSRPLVILLIIEKTIHLIISYEIEHFRRHFHLRKLCVMLRSVLRGVYVCPRERYI